MATPAPVRPPGERIAAALGRECIVRAGEVELQCWEQGSGPLVVLLHGFPDSAYTWRHQAPALARAGFRVVAANLRGYGRSTKPRGVGAYDVDQLAADVAALVRALGERRAAAVVGHDWGGMIAWQLAARAPDVVERLVVLNAPHPAAFARELRTPDQLLRSSYALFFQLPAVPEWLLARRDFGALRRSIRREVRRDGEFTREDWQAQRAALAEPGALSAALNYYRAAARRTLRGRAPFPRIESPTLLLWGERDSFLRVELTEGLEPWLPRLEVERFPSAGHWVQWDEAEGVTAAMLRFLGAPA